MPPARAPRPEQLYAGLLRRLPEGPARQAFASTVRAVLSATFTAGQRLGLHVTPNAYFSPVPDTRFLAEELWSPARALPGVDLREEQQVELLHALEPRLAEVEGLPARRADPLAYELENPKFGTVDAHIAYALVRRHRPRRIVEIGSGWSTMLLLAALDANAADGHPGELVACEPYPAERLSLADRQGRLRLRATALQALPLTLFSDLAANDVVFVDSSHVLKIGSDVHRFLLEILPRLPAGVLVHFHDIFLPQEYPRDWIVRLHRFYNEQYVLQAFLSFNNAFEVVWGSSLMHLRHPDLLEATIGSYRPHRHHPGSLWLRRMGAGRS